MKAAAKTIVKTPDLSSLNDAYEIVGELCGRTDAAVFIAKRRDAGDKRHDDWSDVVIVVAHQPDGDEGNALSQFAADTKLLATLKHRRLIPIREGRWIGSDAFAVVTKRIAATTLRERLSAGEAFSNPRIAAILRELNALLEWARAQKIVHRALTLDTVWLEPDTDRVQVSFAIKALPIVWRPEEEADARTIASLAWSMLSRTAKEEPAKGSLATLRPDLSRTVIEATEALLHTASGVDAANDIAGYLATVAMSDPLFAGETEAARLHAEVSEAHRIATEALAAERDTLLRETAAEREALRAAMEAEREAMRRTMQAELAAGHAELAALRATLEQRVAADRAALAAERAEIKRRGEAELERIRQAELARLAKETPDFDPALFIDDAFVPPSLGISVHDLAREDAPARHDDRPEA